MALLAKSPLMVMMSRTRWPEEHFAGRSFDVDALCTVSQTVSAETPAQ